MRVRKADLIQRLCVLRPKDPQTAVTLAAELVEQGASPDEVLARLLQRQPHTLVGFITDTGKKNPQEESIYDGAKVLGPILEGDVFSIYEPLNRQGINIGDEFDYQ